MLSNNKDNDLAPYVTLYNYLICAEGGTGYMNILIIEDDKLILTALKHALKESGHDVDSAENAEEAISKIEDDEFDLIISDVMMPGISGLSLITILRTVHLSKIPIIVMSALTNESLLQAAYEAGANDFIAKPFTRESLMEKIEKYNKVGQEVHKKDGRV
jgi:two-component system, OmpR family, response regulator VicR